MWRRMGEEIPKPKAILSISAHWDVSQQGTPARTIPRISRFLTLVGWCGGEVQGHIGHLDIHRVCRSEFRDGDRRTDIAGNYRILGAERALTGVNRRIHADRHGRPLSRSLPSPW